MTLLAVLLLATAFPQERFEAAEPHMGTLVRITLYAKDADAAREAFAKAFARIAELNQKLSDYLPDSEVSRVSQSPASASADLERVLAFSQQMARRTNGAFDVTAGPLTLLWRNARRAGRIPTEAEIRDAAGRTGYRHLKLRGGKVWFTRPGMRLDLGAVAKGYAADQALAALASLGIRSALVAVSGDLALGDPPPGRAGWRVALEPRAGGDAQVMDLANCGVSTSGDREQYLEVDGVRYSHILDPRTGHALTRPASASVVAPSAMQADAIATAVCVLGDGRVFRRDRGVTIR